MSELEPVYIRNPHIREDAVLLDEVNGIVYERLREFALPNTPERTPWLVVANLSAPHAKGHFSPPFSFGEAPQRLRIQGSGDIDNGEWTVKTLNRRLRSGAFTRKPQMYDFYTEEHRFWYNEGYLSTNLRLRLYDPMSLSTAGYTSDFPPYGNSHALRRLYRSLTSPGLTTTDTVDEKFLFKSSPLSRLALLALSGIRLRDKF